MLPDFLDMGISILQMGQVLVRGVEGILVTRERWTSFPKGGRAQCRADIPTPSRVRVRKALP